MLRLTNQPDDVITYLVRLASSVNKSAGDTQVLRVVHEEIFGSSGTAHYHALTFLVAVLTDYDCQLELTAHNYSFMAPKEGFMESQKDQLLELGTPPKAMVTSLLADWVNTTKERPADGRVLATALYSVLCLLVADTDHPYDLPRVVVCDLRDRNNPNTIVGYRKQSDTGR